MRDPGAAKALAALPGVKVFALDVTEEASVTAAVAQAGAAFGAIDVLVNNAGYGLFGPFESASEEVIRRQFETNVFGLFKVTHAVLPAMRERGSGTIITVASIGGLMAFPLFSLYHATKFAVVGFSESLAFELAPLGIAVKTIAPGGVATDFASRSMARTFEGDAGPYAPTVGKVMARFGTQRANYASGESLGQAILGAATDGSKRVLYVIGDDANAFLATRAQLGPEAFATLLTQRFGLDAAQSSSPSS